MATLTALRDDLAMQQELAKAAEEMLILEPEDEDAMNDLTSAHAAILELENKIQALQPKAAPPPADEVPLDAAVGDTVLAKYSEDKQFYAATVISKTGSSSDPVYVVKFKGYGNVETVRKGEIKQSEASKKRKADGPATTGNTSFIPPPPPVDKAVISAPPTTIDKPVIKKKEPSLVSDGPTRLPPEPKKLKNSKALNKSQQSWQNWKKTGPKGAEDTYKQKDSQFRTSTLPGAKVGFTGSGQGMKKDQKKAQWTYSMEKE